MIHRRVLRFVAPCFALILAIVSPAIAQTAVPAIVSNLGSSCGNPVPQIAVTGAAIGTVAKICIDSAFPGNPATMEGHVIILASFPPPLPYAVFPPTFPGFGTCTVYVDLANITFLETGTTDAQGDFCVDYPIANDPALIGQTVNIQARVWALGGPYEGGDHLSNALQITFGSTNVSGTGRTPGFWKQPQHFQYWPAPYTPNTLFSAVFDDAFPGMTLLQVLAQGGGGLKALGRHAVAALLNSASTNVNFALSTSMVITLFNAAVPGTTTGVESLKNYLESLNQTEGGIFP